MTLPRIQPVIPIRRKEPFDDPDWLFEFKYDGFRGLWYCDRGRNRFISRNGNRLSRFDALADHVTAALDVEEAILDGEVIVCDATGWPQFYDLLRHAQAPAYVAFDFRPAASAAQRAPQGAGSDPAGEIADHLRTALGKGSKLFALMCAHDLEGIVVKRLRDPYGARTRWLKIKNPDYSQQEGRADLLNGPRRSAAF